MDLKTFIRLYKEFLQECEHKGWHVEVLIEEFENYLAALKNKENIEVQFFIEIDLENMVELSNNTNQSMLDYGVIREDGNGDLFAKEVLDAFHSYIAKQLPKRKYIYYKPPP